MHEMVKYNVKSKKYGISGEILDWGVVTKLCFSFQGRDVEMAIRPNPLVKVPLQVVGEKLIDSYVENLHTSKERKIKLHHWHIEREIEGCVEFSYGRGVVSGHPRIPDTHSITTSNIMAVFVNWEEEELVLKTVNTTYNCPLSSCSWDRQDQYPEAVPEYEKIREMYYGKKEFPKIAPGNVLLALSNYDDYYFHSLCFIPPGESEPLDYCGYPHIGMIQDSYLISVEDTEIDLRYFPHLQNIVFYSTDTEGYPLFVENIGDIVLFVVSEHGVIKLAPGERKEVIPDNVEADEPVLPDGDLYPAKMG